MSGDLDHAYSQRKIQQNVEKLCEFLPVSYFHTYNKTTCLAYKTKKRKFRN